MSITISNNTRNIVNNIAQEVIDEHKHVNNNILSTDDLEGYQSGLTSYLSCLQEALKIIQKSNANTLEQLDQEINSNKKIPKATRSILKTEINQMQQFSNQGMKSNIDALKINLQEGIKDIESLRNSISSNLIKSQNKDGKLFKKDGKGIINDAVKDTGKGLLASHSKSALINIDLSEMQKIASLVRQFTQEHDALSKGKSNNHHQVNIANSQNKNQLPQDKYKEKNIKTKEETIDNTNIKYADKGLGDYTTVKKEQIENKEGIITEKIQDSLDNSLSQEQKKSEYKQNVAYDIIKDNGMFSNKDFKDTSKAGNDIMNNIIDGIISDDNPNNEHRPNSTLKNTDNLSQQKGQER